MSLDGTALAEHCLWSPLLAETLSCVTSLYLNDPTALPALALQQTLCNSCRYLLSDLPLQTHSM